MMSMRRPTPPLEESQTASSNIPSGGTFNSDEKKSSPNHRSDRTRVVRVVLNAGFLLFALSAISSSTKSAMITNGEANRLRLSVEQKEESQCT